MPIRVYAGGAPPEDLVKADWSVSAPNSLAANPPSDDNVLALLHRLTEEGELGICSFRFADLRHSGNLSLVVSASDGRNCYLSIIDKTPAGFERYASPARADVEGIEDLEGNGQLEVIVDTEFTSHQGATHCVAIWPVVYAWTGGGYTDVSRSYKEYYQRKLASLRDQMAAHSFAAEEARAAAASHTAASRSLQAPVMHAIQGSGSSGATPLEVQVPAPATTPSPVGTPDLYVRGCTEAEAAKIERFLGIDKDAGMADAIKWADSENPSEREFAADVLQDIGTPDAVEYLRTLSHDSNRQVAIGAQISLKAVGRSESQTFEREEVKQPTAGSPPN